MEKSWKRDVLYLLRSKTQHCVIYWVNVGKILYNKIPRQAISHEIEGLETTGGKMGSLNNQIKFPELRNKCDIVQIIGCFNALY